MGRYVGERLAFQGERCTVRYVGGIENKRRDWLGVEWDDPRKGRHDGSYEGVKYFQCKIFFSSCSKMKSTVTISISVREHVVDPFR